MYNSVYIFQVYKDNCVKYQGLTKLFQFSIAVRWVMLYFSKVTQDGVLVIVYDQVGYSTQSHITSTTESRHK